MLDTDVEYESQKSMHIRNFTIIVILCIYTIDTLEQLWTATQITTVVKFL